MAIETATPPVLFKYYPPERIDILDNWTVRFTNPANFNDAFDTNWPASEIGEKAQRLKFRNSIGIFSLSEDARSHLMWVHYANQHTGFVMGFRSNAQFLKDADGKLRKVTYEVPPINTLPLSERCWYKDPDWTYEQEWRCIRTIGSGKPRDIAFEPQDIAEIIIGSEMSDSNINAILNFVGALDAVQADVDQDESIRLILRLEKPDISSRAIRLDACDWSLCNHCNGRGHVRGHHFISV